MTEGVRPETKPAPKPETKPETKSCAFCGVSIPIGARRCNTCTAAFQDWRRWRPPLTLAALTPLIGVITAIYAALSFSWTNLDNFLHRNSNTTVSFTGADAATVHLVVTNTGRRPSELGTCILDLGRMNIEEARLVPLYQAPQGRIVQPGANLPVTYLVRGLVSKTNAATAKPFTPAEIDPLLDRETGTVCVSVRESTGKRASRCDDVEGILIRTLVQKKLAE